MLLLCVQEKLSELDKVMIDLKKEIEKLKEELAAKSSPPENPGTKVVVVTPKITVSMPDGSMIDHGKMRLPMHVLQVLYTRTPARTHARTHARTAQHSAAQHGDNGERRGKKYDLFCMRS